MERDERDKNFTDRGNYNQSKGRELYNQDRNQHRQQDNNRQPDRQWGEGNFFHTGPSERGAQDRDRNSYNQQRGGASHSSYQQGNNAHLNDHYGSRSNSAYRNESNYLNHGDRHNNSQHDQRGNSGGSLKGNFNEHPSQHDDIYREGPGSRSRYKEADYRYGSGSHNWYRENRYTKNNDDRDNNRDDRGFFGRLSDGVRDGWNDIINADDRDYQDRNQNRNQSRNDNSSDRERRGSEPFRDRRYDQGYEGGPRWADETDSGKDNYYNDTDRNQRYRR